MTENIHVRSHHPRWSAADVAKLAEAQRAHLFWHWREQATPARWTPRCEVVIHASRTSYLSSVGRGGETSYGSSLLNIRKGRCLSRRIDLLPDAKGELSALAHELTHVAVSDMLGSVVIPRWLDEGIAILADSPGKQKLHDRDLQLARQRGQAMPIGELVTRIDYPVPTQIPVFYAESASLISFLARRGGPVNLLKFVEQAQDDGYDAALRDLYDINGLAQLNHLWQADRTSFVGYPGQVARNPPADIH